MRATAKRLNGFSVIVAILELRVDLIRASLATGRWEEYHPDLEIKK